MPTGLYSDPYLKSLIEQKPDLAEQFFQTIAESDYFYDPCVTLCLETPGWILEKALTPPSEFGDREPLELSNPNFPLEKFTELIKNQEFLESNFKWILKNPTITQTQINELIKNKDIDIKCLALMHPLGDEKKLLELLSEIFDNKNNDFKNLSYICETITLTDDVFKILFHNHTINAHKYLELTIGQILFENPTLTEEQKTLLVLSEIKPKDKSYWNANTHINFISSVPFVYFLKGNEEKPPRKKAPLSFNSEILDFLMFEGHHLSTLLPNNIEKTISISLEKLEDLNSHHFLFRLFWTELCARDDFNIIRRSGYRTDQLFISHPVLSREFDESHWDGEKYNVVAANGEIFDSFRLGGVLDNDEFSGLKWLNEEAYVSQQKLESFLTYYEDSISENFDYFSKNDFLWIPISLDWNNPENSKKYGFELKEEAKTWAFEEAADAAEFPEDFDLFAELNPEFEEILSWHKLPLVKKKLMFDFLVLGLKLPDSKLKKDLVHFLGCMALHDSTPPEILFELGKLNIPIIDEILNSRLN